MKLSDLSADFPKDIAVPPLLAKLVEFEEKLGTHYSGQFELTDMGPSAALAWFDKDKQAASQVILFGHESDDSFFGFWLGNGATIDKAPIVYLGSEGAAAVMANSLMEFFALLAVGPNHVGIGPYGSEDSGNPAKGLAAFRKWLKKEFSITRPTDPGEIIMNARDTHPDFQAWINAWQKSHFG